MTDDVRRAVVETRSNVGVAQPSCTAQDVAQPFRAASATIGRPEGLRYTRLPVILIVALTAVASSLVTLAAQKHVQKSTVFAWTSEDAKPNAWGKVRQVVRTPT